jgi:inosine-uridine nucleoside N-ribohydrolase
MAAGGRRVIIDCDPGHDDAVAILLAAKHLDVAGITTVAGNQTLENVTSNALKVLELGGLKHITVAKGCAQPLLKEPRHAAAVHGETGLDGYSLPSPSLQLHASRAVEFIIDTVMSGEGITLVPVGPLTNIAVALRLEPRLAGRVEGISLMGGSTTGGNVTAAAEFNIWFDPEAADVVFRSGVPITMCGLNLTHQASVGDGELARIRAIGNRVSEAIAALLTFYRAGTAGVSGKPLAYLHDPCAVAVLIDPSLFEFEEMHVAVELRGTHTAGMTVCDRRFAGPAARRAVGAPEPNARVATRIDQPRFMDLLCETLALY